MTTPLFLLRCVELGISIRDLDLLTIGLVLDMWSEKANDNVAYSKVATQEDFDSAMANVAAISGATGDDLQALRDKARDMGEKTKFSASEAAEAMSYI